MPCNSEVHPQICCKIHIAELYFCICNWLATSVQLKAWKFLSYFLSFSSSCFQGRCNADKKTSKGKHTLYMLTRIYEILHVTLFYAGSQNKWQAQLGRYIELLSSCRQQLQRFLISLLGTGITGLLFCIILAILIQLIKLLHVWGLSKKIKSGRSS